MLKLHEVFDSLRMIDHRNDPNLDQGVLSLPMTKESAECDVESALNNLPSTSDLSGAMNTALVAASSKVTSQINSPNFSSKKIAHFSFNRIKSYLPLLALKQLKYFINGVCTEDVFTIQEMKKNIL